MDFDKTMSFNFEKEKNARNKIRQIERDELLDKMVRNYIGLEE